MDPLLVEKVKVAAQQLDYVPAPAARALASARSTQLEVLDSAPTSMALGGRLLEDLLARHPGVNAVFFCNDDLAQGGLLAALRLQVAVPQRIAVVGFNDLAGSDQMLLPLTTIRTPRAEIGSQAAKMLLALMRGGPVPQSTIDLGFELVVRSSS